VTSIDKRREERRRRKEAGLGNAATPQDRAVEIGSLALNGGNPKLAIERWGDEVRLVVRALTDAGLLSSGTQEDQGGEGDGSLRSWPSAGGREERKSPRLRRSGSPWTLRVHTWDDDVQTPSHTVSNRAVPADSEHHRGHLFPQAEFDELVVGRWLHVEQMDNATWWMNVGGVTVHVNADREGRPRRVRVNGPLDYDEPREGCEYEIEWTEPK
jgi:hypothetical protein